MKVEKIDRVVIAVKDLDKAMEFFSSLLGTRFGEVREGDELKVRLAYCDLGLELMESTAEGSMVDKFIRKRGEGILMLVFKVADIEEAKRFFQEKGLQPVGGVNPGGLKEVAFHPKDAHGIQIVLCEYEVPHPAECAALHIA